MAGVSKESGAIKTPLRMIIHIFQLPNSEAVRIREREQAFCNRIEITVYLKNVFERDLLVVCCTSKVSITGHQKILTMEAFTYQQQ